MLAGQRGLAEPEPGEPKLVLAVPQARDTCTGPAKRDVSAGWTTRATKWSLPPVLLRLGIRTKDPGRLLPGGENGPPSEARRRATGEEWSQPPVLPWARRAYETCLSAGSTAGSGAGERSRTVVSALARPHSAVEPHPQMVSPAGVSPATWRLGRARSVL